jgi:hypothetical protein
VKVDVDVELDMEVVEMEADPVNNLEFEVRSNVGIAGIEGIMTGIAVGTEIVRPRT